MARSIWKGSIAFGLVDIPVSLVGAEAGPDLQLHMVDSKNPARIRYERVNADTGDEVPWDRMVPGDEHDDGKLVPLTDEELEAAAQIANLWSDLRREHRGGKTPSGADP
jgi:DNA end-binding protein Ku